MRADPLVVEAVRSALRPGKENARSGQDIARALFLSGLRCHRRRVGEAVAELVEQGLPVCSTAADGYYLATKAEEIEESLREAEKRCRMTLRRRRFLRRALALLRGQKEIAA